MVLSADPTRDPSTLAITGAGAALAISDIPFEHVLGAVRVGMVDGKLVANPTYEETKASKVNIVVAGTEGGIVMVESGAQQVTEAEVLAAIEFGHECCKKLAAGARELAKKVGKTKKTFVSPEINKNLYQEIETAIRAELEDGMNTQKYEKLDSYSRIHEAEKKAVAAVPDEQKKEASALFERLQERIFRDQMLKNKRRPDGRKFDEVRNIECEVGVLPRTHGSSLFTRGETQALVTATLGTKDDEQRIELLDASESSKRFMLHYNFPPFSVGEVGFMRGAGRREIGHGALAERAIAAVIPDDATFPYTMRIVSDIMESNGSSSMASVCGATLSLLDAGVPISSPVAGIAMGLVMEGKDYAVLTDIAGAEDHYGDMDFKVAGTQAGITALQMDIKVPNVTAAIMKEALEQARQARLHILGQDECGDRHASHHAFEVRAAHLHDADPDRQDPRSDRQGRLHDPQHRRNHGLQDRCRGRRQREDFLGRRHCRGPLHPDDHRHLRGGRSGQDVSGQSGADRRFRRVRRDLPRHRRPAAHFRDLGKSHQAGSR